MTLNIAIASEASIHVGADLRLVDGDTGTIVSNSSPKLVTISEKNWDGAITYCGVGRFDNRDTAQWLVEWLKHDPDASRTFEETAASIERHGNTWLNRIKTRLRTAIPHSFILIGIDGTRPQIALISNTHRLNDRTDGTIRPNLTTELGNPVGRAIVTGMSDAVPPNDKRMLLAALKTDDATEIQRKIARVISSASQSKESRESVSEACYTYSFLTNGNGSSGLHGKVNGRLETLTLQQGLDPMAAIRGQLGPQVQITATSSVHIRPNRSEKLDECTPEPDALDPLSQGSGYRLVELHAVGGPNADASSINSHGYIAGYFTEKLNGPLYPCVWTSDFAFQRISLNGASCFSVCGITDSMLVAGGIALPDSLRAFVFENGNIHISSTLGGRNVSLGAINEDGVVVGSSWTLPGNDPGDKLDRAFRWHLGGTMEAIGEVPADWCSRATRINQEGTIIGNAYRSGFPPGPSSAFRWSSDSGMKALSGRGGTSFSAVSINNRGEVVCSGPAHDGGMYYLWDKDGNTKKLELPNRTDVVAINDAGALLCNRQTDNGRRACIWRDAREIVLPTFRGHECDARAFNSLGHVVGVARRGSHSHAVVWIPEV